MSLACSVSDIQISCIVFEFVQYIFSVISEWFFIHLDRSNSYLDDIFFHPDDLPKIWNPHSNELSYSIWMVKFLIGSYSDRFIPYLDVLCYIRIALAYPNSLCDFVPIYPDEPSAYPNVSPISGYPFFISKWFFPKFQICFHRVPIWVLIKLKYSTLSNIEFSCQVW